MTCKERVKAAFSYMKPDRVPVFAEFVPEVREKLYEYFGVNDPHQLGVIIGNDMLMHTEGIQNSYYGPQEEYTCRWGIKWKYFDNPSGRYTEMIERPLSDDPDGKKLLAYTIPDPTDESIYLPFRELVKKYGNDYFICGSLACTIFESSWYLHGLEETIIDMVLRPEYMGELFDKVMQFPLLVGLQMIDEGADMIWLGDDIGTQDKMMLSPTLWRETLKPRLAKIITAYKERNPDIIVAYHSCGYIEPVIEDLIDIGVDVLNPVQPHAMDPAILKKKYGNRLSFWGSIDIQYVLPHGTKDDIYDEVSLRMQTIGKDGGLLMGPAHNIQADTSIENILAFYEAAKELGKYD
ncbi:MAG: hypothetical protein FWG21_00105 [Oscillospiraceae bacterium]|nr:hypothetical protein [Oscillospiraceae bacterium]